VPSSEQGSETQGCECHAVCRQRRVCGETQGCKRDGTKTDNLTTRREEGETEQSKAHTHARKRCTTCCNTVADPIGVIATTNTNTTTENASVVSTDFAAVATVAATAAVALGAIRAVRGATVSRRRSERCFHLVEILLRDSDVGDGGHVLVADLDVGVGVISVIISDGVL
jgi:hypothetical protein